MIINKKEIQEALRIVKPGLGDGKTNIDQSSSFAFIDNYVVTYNDQISIKHPVENLDLRGAIKADELYQLIDKIKKDEFDLSVKGTQLLIKSGRMKSWLSIDKEITLPLIEAKFRWKDLPENFCKSIEFAAPVCSRDFSKIVLTCVHIIREGLVEASDSYRVLKKELSDEMPVESFLLPAVVVRNIVQLSPIKISMSKNWVHFLTENKTIISCRLMEGIFPDVNPHFISEGTKIILPSRINEILEKARVFAKKDFVYDERVSIVIEKGGMKVISKSDTGKFEESAKIKYKGNPVSFDITPVLFEHILKQTRTFILKDKKVVFFGPDWKYLVLLRNTN